MEGGETQYQVLIVYILYRKYLSKMKKKFNNYEAIQGNFIFRIEEDYPEVGVYLYIYEDGHCIKDYLQNDIDTCKSIALEEYNVQINSWILGSQQ